MENPEPGDVKTLIDIKKGELEQSDAFEVLSNVRSENVWLANFSSENTRDAYQRSVTSFIATLGITTPDDLYACPSSEFSGELSDFANRGSGSSLGSY